MTILIHTMKKYFILVLILVSNLFFSQTNINSKISTLYAKLNFLKQETRKSEREINAINTENLSSRWLFRKDFIINNNKTSLRGIESSIEVIPSIQNESDQIIWCGKIDNMMNEYEESLTRFKDKLIDDIGTNTIKITRSNFGIIAFDDLVSFLYQKTGRTQSQMKSDYEQQSNKYKSFRDYLEHLIQFYIL